MKNRLDGWIIYDARNDLYWGKDNWTKDEPRVYVVASHAEWNVNQIKRHVSHGVFSYLKHPIELRVYPCNIVIDLFDGGPVDLKDKAKFRLT